MATPLDALLRIKAQVTGAPAVQALGGAIGGVQKQAAGAVGALRRMGAASGGLGGALGALTPLLSAAGLGAMAMNAIKTGDALYDMAQRTGVSVETLAKFSKIARISGSSIEEVESGLIKLTRTMAAVASSQFGEKTKEEMDQAKDAIERGEKDAVRAVERGLDRRIAVLDRETDRRLDKLSKRYRREEQLLNDFYDDQAAAADDAAQDQTDAQIKQLDRAFDARRRAVQADKSLSEASQTAVLQQLEDQRDAQLDVIRDGAAKAQTIRQRASRDARQEQLDALEERKKAEAEAMKAAAASQNNAMKESARLQVESLKEISEQRKKALGGESEDGLGDSALNARKAADAFKYLGISVTDTAGRLRPTGDVMLELSKKLAALPDGSTKTALALAIIPRTGANLIPFLNEAANSFDKIKTAFTTGFSEAADRYSDKMTMLSGRIGALGLKIAVALLPTIEALTDSLAGFFAWVDKQGPGVQNLVTGLTVAAVAFAFLAPLISAVTNGMIANSIATNAAAISAAASGTAAATASVGWAALLGPIGLVIIAAAAVGAAFVLAWQNFAWFRDGITAGLAAISQGWQGAFTLIKGILAGDSALITKGWNMMIDGIKAATIAGFQFTMKVIGEASKWLLDQIMAMPGRLANGVRAIGQAIGNGIAAAVRSILGGMFRWMADRVNWMSGQINRLIRTINRTTGSSIGELGQITVPAFAQGGYVTGPTVGLVGEAGREYIVPEGKAGAFANNILAGRRGALAIPSGSSSGGGGGGSVSINITTGPVMQDQSGQRWMTIEDGERLARDVAAQVMRTSRTPGGRYMMGVRNG